MEKFSIKKFHKEEIDKIWNNATIQNIELLSRGYAIPDEIKKNAILFIGFNPSFPGDSKKGSHFYDNYNEKTNLYLEKFKEISEKVSFNWSHLDLLYFRETEQKYIWKLLKENNGIDFIYKQLMLSKEMIFMAEPKIIVVSNTMARHFMGLHKEKDKIKNKGVWMDFDSEFDNNLGTHRLTNTELKDTPVFFTSMLTGQRALDTGSFERLVWHINFVVEKLSSPNF